MKRRRIVAHWSDGKIWEEQFVNDTKTVMSRVAMRIMDISIHRGARQNNRILVKAGYNLPPIRSMVSYQKHRSKHETNS